LGVHYRRLFLLPHQQLERRIDLTTSGGSSLRDDQEELVPEVGGLGFLRSLGGGLTSQSSLEHGLSDIGGKSIMPGEEASGSSSTFWYGYGRYSRDFKEE
jgi:hypothetical protein